MKKAILMSIQPTWVSKILNGEKTLEIRKDAPKEWKDYLSGKTKEKPKSKLVYIYCTKGNKKESLIADLQPDKVYHPLTELLHRGVYSIVDEDLIWNDCKKNILNGKVVAKFTLNEVEEIPTVDKDIEDYALRPLESIKWWENLYKKSCLTEIELNQYLKNKVGYAWHIDNLVIFDKPKELSEFYKWTDKTMGLHVMPKAKMVASLTHAPQSWQFVEV